MREQIVALVLSLATVVAGTPPPSPGSVVIAGRAQGLSAAGPAPPSLATIARGKDPAALLARVSAVRYEIYPGVFRGASATLTDRAGNDYDRALLLHDLLLAATPGVAMRYAFCTLSPQQSAAALAAAHGAYKAPTIGTNAQALAVRAATPKLRDGFTRIAGFWKAATAQERQQAAELDGDFQKAGARLQAPTGAALRSIAADHVWVQLQSQGTWLDLDPSAPNAKPGGSVCAPASTSDSLPDAAFDTVTAALHLEARDGTQQRDTVIASGKWRTADLANQTLNFAFAEPSGLRAPAPQPTGMLAFTPLLIAGPKTTAASPITVPAPTEGPAIQTTAAGAVSQVAAAFGDAPPPAPKPPPAPAGPIPVALRVDVSVAVPGSPAVAVERAIFDRVSAADRAAGRAATATLAPVAMLPFGTVWSVAVNLGTGVVGVGDRSAIDPKSDEPATLLRAMGATHRAYYVMRRAVFADASAPSAPPVVSARPGISFLGLAPHATGVTPFGLEMDRASEGALPEGGNAASGLAWGVASVYGERLAIAAPTMMAAHEKLDQLPFDDSIEMFYIARHSNIAPTVVRSGGDVTALRASDDAKARLIASLAGSASAVAPSAPIPYGGANNFGWWILRPDGTVTDEMQSGMHQFTDYGKRLKDIAVESAPNFRKIGFIVRCSGIAVAALMAIAAAQGGEGGTEIAEQAAEQMNVIREANEAEEMREAALECGVD